MSHDDLFTLLMMLAGRNGIQRRPRTSLLDRDAAVDVGQEPEPVVVNVVNIDDGRRRDGQARTDD